MICSNSNIIGMIRSIIENKGYISENKHSFIKLLGTNIGTFFPKMNLSST